MAVDFSGDVWLYNGNSWSSGGPGETSGGNSLAEVSCVSADWCAGVDGSGNALIYSKGNWGPVDAVDPNGGGIYSVSCVDTSAPFCAAGDAQGGVFTYSGGTWSAVDNALKYKVLSVSCTNARFCVAVDNAGGYSLYNGSAWSKAIYLASGGFYGISCPKTTYCLAVAGSRFVEYLNGSWRNVAGSGLDNGAGEAYVSCLSGTYMCTVADDQGNVTTWGPQGWTPQVMADKLTNVPAGDTPAFYDISCPSPNMCMAVDADGNAVVGKAIHPLAS